MSKIECVEHAALPALRTSRHGRARRCPRPVLALLALALLAPAAQAQQTMKVESEKSLVILSGTQVITDAKASIGEVEITAMMMALAGLALLTVCRPS